MTGNALEFSDLEGKRVLVTGMTSSSIQSVAHDNAIELVGSDHAAGVHLKPGDLHRRFCWDRQGNSTPLRCKWLSCNCARTSPPKARGCGKQRSRQQSQLVSDFT